MFRRSLRNALTALLFAATPAHAVTIAVGSETFLVESFPMPTVSDTSPLPLALAISKTNGNTIYMLPEFDKRYYTISRTATDGTTMTQVPIDGPNSPLFRSPLADTGTTFSSQQEHIQTTVDGSVWMSQGGNCFTTSINNNWSRIMRHRPDGVWEAYTLPIDGACAIGFYPSVTLGQANVGLLVMSKGANAIYGTNTRWWHEGELVATRYPPVDYRWSTTRAYGVVNVFPAKIIQLLDGRFAGTLYFGTAFFLLDLSTQTYTQIALAAPPPDTIAGSSGPWEIVQHPTDGNLWIAEDYAQRVTKYDIRTGVQTVFDLSASLSADEHPHSLAIDGTDIYLTTYSTSASGDGRLVKITNSGTVTVGTSFATISNEGGITGIVRDSGGKLWVAVFRKQKVLRLTRQ